jgi:hypothetical protein
MPTKAVGTSRRAACRPGSSQPRRSSSGSLPVPAPGSRSSTRTLNRSGLRSPDGGRGWIRRRARLRRWLVGQRERAGADGAQGRWRPPRGHGRGVPWWRRRRRRFVPTRRGDRRVIRRRSARKHSRSERGARTRGRRRSRRSARWTMDMRRVSSPPSTASRRGSYYGRILARPDPAHGREPTTATGRAPDRPPAAAVSSPS